VSIPETNIGSRDVSERLRAFVEEMPYERRSIFAFVREVADLLPAGSVVLDVGAGDAPYRELFGHCDYLTNDWEASLHEHAAESDIVASADSLPLDEGCVDAVLLTQVLEHVAEPAAVLTEVARVLRPGGALFATVPFVWELHELPYDFWRFTPASLERLLTGAGFSEIAIEPRTDGFTTIAQLMRNLAGVMGRAPDGRDGERELAGELLRELADKIAGLASLEVRPLLPLGFTVRALRD
jgi:SAM-dependent methyltransferase